MLEDSELVSGTRLREEGPPWGVYTGARLPLKLAWINLSGDFFLINEQLMSENEFVKTCFFVFSEKSTFVFIVSSGKFSLR